MSGPSPRDRARGLRATWENLQSAPYALPDKLRLFARNNLIKLRTRQSCCGHRGEPGC
ncbi:MAG TPA: hypothetical protein VHL09_06120 [Dehalococcoidia bacterium]|nr:hypothetical protein [Dehalococcoidia bacterium]